MLAGFPGFAVATLALTVAAAWLLNVGFRGPGDRSAIAVAAAVAIVVQLGAFPIVRALAARNLMLGWAAGAFCRAAILVASSIASVRVHHMPTHADLSDL